MKSLKIKEIEKMKEQNQYLENVINTYGEQKETKLDKIRFLDKKAKRPAKILTYCIGIIGALVLGVGMCLTLNVIGNPAFSMPLGIIIGVIGIAALSLNYPVYKAVMKSRKRKFSKEILALTNEITDN